MKLAPTIRCRLDQPEPIKRKLPDVLRHTGELVHIREYALCGNIGSLAGGRDRRTSSRFTGRAGSGGRAASSFRRTAGWRGAGAGDAGALAPASMKLKAAIVRSLPSRSIWKSFGSQS